MLEIVNHPFIVKLHYAFQTGPALCLVRGPETRNPRPEPRNPNPEPLNWFVNRLRRCLAGRCLSFFSTVGGAKIQKWGARRSQDLYFTLGHACR